MRIAMNILIVSTYYSHRGGSHVYAIELTELLRKAGHHPIPFAMKFPENLPTEYDKYFVSYIDYQEELKHRRSVIRIAKVLSRTFHFAEAKENIEKLLNNVNIDVVHLHNFLHYITLSIIEPIRKRNIPIVWTLHDHLLVCPNTNLFDDRRSVHCTKCTGSFKRIAMPIFRGCKKKSFSASIAASAEAFYFQVKRVAKIPKIFVAPSEFLARQHKEMGFDTSHFDVVPNFVDCENYVPHTNPGEYAIYFGRITTEKGLDSLIEAFAMLRKYPLIIVGSGPAEMRLKKLAEELSAPIRFFGFLKGEQLKELIYKSRFAIVPSICYENAPLTILESFAAGKPVMGSNIGGIPELITENVGYVFQPNDSESIAQTIASVWDNESLIEQMGKDAREKVEKEYSSSVHIKKIIEIYQKAMLSESK